MPIVKSVNGDLLQAEEKFVIQQCNCVTVKSHGLSESIIRHFGSWADPYSSRSPVSQGRNCAADKDIDIPGTIRTLENPSSSSSDTKIICMFAQWCPGKPGAYSRYYPTNYDDTTVNRYTWFERCLSKIDDCTEIDSPVAVPYNIGCGLAGGYWPLYRKALDNAETEFVLYKL